MRRMLLRLVAVSSIGGTLSAICAVPAASAAEAGIASGKIFGIQIGQPIALTREEQKQAARGHFGSFIRHKAEKPDDVQYLQIYATPITRIVTEVDGASEFPTKARADAYVAKYARLLSDAHPEFRRSTVGGGKYPLDVETVDWRLTIKLTDLKAEYQRAGGYAVRISLKPAFGSALAKLESQAFDERKELDERDRHPTGAPPPADLRGLH